MKKTFVLVLASVLLLGFSSFSLAEDGSWMGYISDEACAKDYAKAGTEKHVACAKGCVTKGGKWALAMKDGMVILDIDKETAEKNLGHPVTVKGSLNKESNTVKVSSVEMSHN
ncbi:MAG: hypothetical protein ACRD3V_21005 [Vicinamibacteria bacterium]